MVFLVYCQSGIKTSGFSFKKKIIVYEMKIGLRDSVVNVKKTLIFGLNKGNMSITSFPLFFLSQKLKKKKG